MKRYRIKKIEDKKKKYIDRIFTLRQHLSGGALWSVVRTLLKRKPKQNKMFVYESRFVDSKIVVSVVVPLYNTLQQYLRAMIESVLEQTYPNWELCLADGSDTDVVCQICQEYFVDDERGWLWNKL